MTARRVETDDIMRPNLDKRSPDQAGMHFQGSRANMNAAGTAGSLKLDLSYDRSAS
jgi:hypothetical protein